MRKHKANQYHDGDFIPDKIKYVRKNTNEHRILYERIKHGILYKISI